MFGNGKVKRWIGNLMLIRTRIAAYVSFANFFMMAYVFWKSFDNRTLGSIILFLGCVSLMALLVFDWYFIMLNEFEVSWQKNPEWKKLTERLDIILEKKPTLKDGHNEVGD